jgi:hypothetical protein
MGLLVHFLGPEVLVRIQGGPRGAQGLTLALCHSLAGGGSSTSAVFLPGSSVTIQKNAPCPAGGTEPARARRAVSGASAALRACSALRTKSARPIFAPKVENPHRDHLHKKIILKLASCVISNQFKLKLEQCKSAQNGLNLN